MRIQSVRALIELLYCMTLPLSQTIVPPCFQHSRLIATDMDGTLTTAGKFTADLLTAFDALADAGIPVLIVTGRSAGWVSGLVNYLPIAGAIAENGGLFYATTGTETPLVTIPDWLLHRQQLAQMFQRVQTQFPDLQESSDNRFRLTDWTFDVQGLAVDDIHAIEELCHSSGWGFTYSNVQCHIKLLHQDKANGLLQVLRQFFPDYPLEQIVTVGDSPNDESLFNTQQFPLSVGVANIHEYRDRLTHKPAYITTAAAGDGFLELARLLLASRT